MKLPMKLSKLKLRNAQPSRVAGAAANARPVSLRLQRLVLPGTAVVLALLLAFPGVRHSLYPSSEAPSSAPESRVISPNTHTDGQRWWSIADSFRDGSTLPGAGGIARLFENSAAVRAVETFYDDGILGALRTVQTIIDGGFSRLLQAPADRTSTTLTVNLRTEPPPDRSLSTVDVMQPTPEQPVEFELIIRAEDGAGDGKALDGIDLHVRLMEGDATLVCPTDAELCDPVPDTRYTLQSLSVDDTGYTTRAVSVTLEQPPRDAVLRVTVNRGSLNDELLFRLRAAEPRRLERLELVAVAPPARQARPGAQISFAVDLKSFDNYDDPYAVADLSFSAVLDRGTLVSPQGVETLALDQSGVTRRTVVMVPQTMQDTTLTLTFSDGGVISDTLVQRILASPALVLGSLMVVPEVESPREQSGIGQSNVIDMEVIPLDQQFGDPLNSGVGSLRVSVTASNRAEIIFPVGGTAEITPGDNGFFITRVEVLARGQDTSISITFSSLDGVVSKTVQRRIKAVPSTWTAVQIDGPASPPTQAAIDEDVSFDIVIRTVDEYGLPFVSAELQLEVAVSGGATLLMPDPSSESIAPLSGPDYSISRTIVVLPPRGLEAMVTITVSGIRADGTDTSTTLTQRVLPAPRVLSALAVTVATPPPAQELPDAEVSFVIELGARDNYDDLIAVAGLELSVQASEDAMVVSSAMQTVSLEDSGTTTLVVTVTPQIGRDTTVMIMLSDPVTGLVQMIEQQVIAAADRVLSELVVMVVTPPLAQSQPDMPISFVIELGTRDNYGDPIAAADLVLSVQASEEAVLVSSETQSVSLGDSAATLMVTVTPQIGRDTTVTITLSDPVTGLVQSVEQQVLATADRVLSELTVMVTTPPLAQSRPDMPVSFVIELGSRDNYGDRIAVTGLELSIETSDDAEVVSAAMQSVALDDSGTTTLAVTVTPQIGMDTTVMITLSDPETSVVRLTEQRVMATAPRILSELSLSVVRPPVAQLLKGEAIELKLQIETADNYGMPFAFADLQWSAMATEEAELPVLSSMFSVAASGVATPTVMVIPSLNRDTTVTVTVSGTNADGVSITDSLSQRVVAAVPGLLAALELEVIGAVAEASTPGSVVDIQLQISATDATGTRVAAAGLMVSVVEVRAEPSLVATETVSVDASGTLLRSLSVVPGTRGLIVQVSVSGFAGIDGRAIMATLEIPVRGAGSTLQSLVLELVSEPARQDQIGSGEAVVAFELEIAAFDDFDLPFPAEDLEFMVTLSGDAQLRSAPSGILSLGSFGEARQLVVMVAPQTLDTTVTVMVSSGTVTASLEQLVAIPRLSELQIELPAEPPRQESPDTEVDFEIVISARDNYDFPIAADDLALSVTADEGAMVTTPMQIVSLDDSGSAAVVVTVTPEIGRDTTVIIVVLDSVDNSISARVLQQVTAAELRRLDQLMVTVTTTPTAQDLPESPVDFEVGIRAFDNYGDPFAATDLELSIAASDGAMLVSAMMDTLSLVDVSKATTVEVTVVPQNGFDTTVTITVRDSVDNSIRARVLQRVAAADPRVLSELVIERLGFPLQLLEGEVVELMYEIRATDNYGMPFAFDGLLQWSAETRFVTIPAEFPGGSIGTLSVGDSGVAVLTVAVIPAFGVGNSGILLTVVGENANGDTIDHFHVGEISVPVAERLALLELELIGDVPIPGTAGAEIDIPLRISALDAQRMPVAAPGLMLSVDVGAGRLVSPEAMTIVDVSTSGRTVPLRVVPGRSGFTLTVVVSGFADFTGRSSFPDDFELPISDRLERRIAGSPPVLQRLAVAVVSGPRREDQMVNGAPAAVVVFEVDISAVDDLEMAFPAENLVLSVMQSGDAQLLSPAMDTVSLPSNGAAQRVVMVALQTMDTTVTVTVSSGTISASLEQLIEVPRLEEFEITLLGDSPQQALPGDAVVLEFQIEARDNYDLPIAADNLQLEVTVNGDTVLVSSQTQTFSVSASGSIVLTVTLLPQPGETDLMLRVSDSADEVVGVLSQPVIGADEVALTRFVVGFTEELQPQSEIGEQTDAMISIAALDNYDRPLAVANAQLAVQIEGEGAILLSQGSEVLELGTDGLTRALSFLSIAGRAATLTVTVSSGDVTGMLVSDVSGVELRSPQSSVGAVLSTGTVRAGVPFGLDVSYLAPPNVGEQVRRLLIYLFYDSRVLDFVGAEGLLQTGLLATPMEGDAQADRGDQDGNMATDRVLIVRWMQTADGWPGVALPAKLLTAMFVSRGFSQGAVNTELGVLATISTAHFRVATVPVVITTPTARIPDVNGNNRVDINDLVVLQRFFAAVAGDPSADLTDPQMAALIFNIAGATAVDLSAFRELLDPEAGRVLDISGDGLFDRTDSLWLFRYLSGIGRSGMPDTFDRPKARQILGLSSLSR